MCMSPKMPTPTTTRAVKKPDLDVAATRARVGGSMLGSMSSTLKTGALGLTGDAAVAKKTLLGG